MPKVGWVEKATLSRDGKPMAKNMLETEKALLIQSLEV